MSLGSLVALFTAIKLGENKIKNKVNNMFLLGSVIDYEEFCDAIPLLIGENGVVRGKIYISYHKGDKTLSYLLKKVKREKAIGCSEPDYP